MVYFIRKLLLGSLSRQITILSGTFVFIASVTYTFYSFQKDTQHLRNMAESDGSQLIAGIALIASEKVHFEDWFSLWSTITKIRNLRTEKIEQIRGFTIRDIIIIDLNGNVLAHTNPEENPLMQPYNHLHPTESIDLGNRDAIHKHWHPEANSLRLNTAIVYDERVSGMIILDLDTEYLLSSQRSLIKNSAILFILLMLPGLVISFVFGRWLTEPLEKAVSSTHRIGSGDLRLPNLISRYDEYRTLGQALEKVDSKIYKARVGRKQAEESLQKAYDELEIRVEERTAELKELNKSLRGEIAEREHEEELREALNKLSLRLIEPLKAKEIGKIVAEESRHLFHHDAFSLDLIDESKCNLVGIYNEDTPVGTEEPKEVPTQTIPLESVRNRELLKGETKLINRLEEPSGTDLITFGEKSQLSRSLMFVPILREKRTVGILSIQSYIPGRYGEKDLILLQAFASQCSGALTRLHAEQSLRESEEKYRTLVESSPGYIFLLNRKGRILDMNPAVGQEELEDLIVSHVYDDLILEDQEIFKENIKKCFEYRSVKEFEVNSINGKYVFQVFLASVKYADMPVEYVVCNMYDITERKTIEAELIRLASFPELQPNPIIETDLNCKVTYVNPVAAKQFSYRKLGKKNHPILKELPSFIKRFKKGEKNILIREIEYNNRIYEQQINYVTEVDRIRIYHRDVTTQKLAEKALRFRVEFESIINSISTKFINLSAEEVDTGINDTLMIIGEFVGVDRCYVFQLTDGGTKIDNTHEWCPKGIKPQIDNLQGLPVDMLPWWMDKLNRLEEIHIPHVVDLPPEASAEKEILETQDIQSLIVIPLVYIGSLVGFLGFDSVRVERKWSRDDIGLIKIVGEIIVSALQRKFAEQALRKSEEKYRGIVETSHDLIWTTDLKGNYTFLNQRMAEVIGDSIETSLRKNSVKLIHKDDLKIVRKHFAKVLLRKKMQTCEFRIKDKYGRYITLLVTGKPIIENGNVVGAMAFGLDITERKKANEELKKTASELARSNSDLQQFAYVASHDLQEPLRMVGSYTQLLARRYKDKLDSDADEFMEFVLDGVKRMQTLIKDLLKFSRVGTKGKPLDPTDSSVVLKTKLQDLKIAIEESNAVVTYDSLPTIAADEIQLGQLFQNLIGNAIKFQNKKPPEIHIGVEQKNGEWVFSVKDNGIGIDPQYKDRVFVIFQRLHTRDEFSGTGIGLAVCKKIVERHGGEIWLESKAGEGTTFYFTMPVMEE